ncbi:hypothetical protein [Stenotrophomonas maltophilia]
MFGDLVNMAALRRAPGVSMSTGDAEAVLTHIEQLTSSRDFYKARCEALQVEQAGMRDPERKVVCDILANGQASKPIGSK